MSGYDVALYAHLCALFLAFGATGALTLALVRLRTARVGGEALQWLGVGKTVALAFPIVLLTLLASGAYMVHHSWTWSTPWVDAGLAGVVFLGVVGDQVQGGRAKKIAAVLAADPSAPVDGRAAAALRDPLFWTAALVNPCVALGVALDMVAKPGALGAGAVLAGAIVVGAAGAVPLWRTGPAATPHPSRPLVSHAHEGAHE